MRKLLALNIALWLLVTFIFVAQKVMAQTPPQPVLCLDYVTLTPTRTTIPLGTITLTPFPSPLAYITQVDPRRTSETLTLNPVYQTATAYPTPTQEVWTVYKVVVNAVNIRTSPSTSASIVSTATLNSTVVVTEVIKLGAIEWGKLESGYYLALSVSGTPYLIKQ